MKSLSGLIFFLLSFKWGYCQNSAYINSIYRTEVDKIVAQIDANCKLNRYKTIVVKDSEDHSMYTTEVYIVDTTATSLCLVKVNRIYYDTLPRHHALPGESWYIASIDTQIHFYYYQDNSLIKVVDKKHKSNYYINGSNILVGPSEDPLGPDFFLMRRAKPYGNEFVRRFRKML